MPSRAGAQQELHDGGVAVVCCMSQCLSVTGVDVRPVVEEKLHNVRAFYWGIARPSQGRIINSVYVSAVLEEDLYHGHMTIQRCMPQHDVLIDVDVGAVCEEKLHHRRMLSRRRVPHRLIVSDMHVRSVGEEDRHDLVVAVPSGYPQSLVVSDVDVHASLEQEEDNVRAGVARRRHELRPSIIPFQPCAVPEDACHHIGDATKTRHLHRSAKALRPRVCVSPQEEGYAVRVHPRRKSRNICENVGHRNRFLRGDDAGVDVTDHLGGQLVPAGGGPVPRAADLGEDGGEGRT